MNEKFLTVFHYCNVEVFHSIMKFYTLRLTDIQNSNDLVERIWIEEKIQKQVIDKINGLRGITEEEKSLVNNNFNIAKEVFQDNSRLYASCFSENGDLLSQWRAYADNGQGLSIGFSKEALDTFNKEMYGMKFLPVCYDEDTQNEYAKEQANSIVESILEGDSIFHAVSEVYENKVSEYSRMKNPMFKEEQEWRLSILMSPECRINNKAYFDKCTLSEIKTYCNKKKILTYFDLNFQDKKNGLINEIVIGPKCGMSERDVKQILFLWGYDVSSIAVRKSKVPYNR